MEVKHVKHAFEVDAVSAFTEGGIVTTLYLKK